MVVVGFSAQRLRDGSLSSCHHLHRQVARSDEQVEDETYGSGGNGGEQCVGHSMAEDASRIFLCADGGQCGGDCQHDGGHGEKLEQAGVDSSDERHQGV